MISIDIAHGTAGKHTLVGNKSDNVLTSRGDKEGLVPMAKKHDPILGCTSALSRFRWWRVTHFEASRTSQVQTAPRQSTATNWTRPRRTRGKRYSQRRRP